MVGPGYPIHPQGNPLQAPSHAPELDPLSAVITAESGWPFIYTGLYERALERFQRALELDPDLALAHFCVGWVLDHLGRYEEAKTLVCQYHGARFDTASGAARGLPAVKPVKSFPVEIREDGIYIQKS